MANKAAIASANAAARAVAARATSAASVAGVELLYSTHPSWPYPPTSHPSASAPAPATLDIAVLDSSFNPPSKAHRALLLSNPVLASPKRQYDAHLLLFSTNNADKGKGKAGDASLEQRLHMMTLLAKQIEDDLEAGQPQQHPPPNVAVALVDQPLIFAKSTLSWDALRRIGRTAGAGSDAEGPLPRPRLHWVVGFDTLYRVFQPKYYPSEAEMERQCAAFFNEERTTFVCARRDATSFPSLSLGAAAADVEDEERRLLQSERVSKWVKQGSIAMLDLDADHAALSSTSIRKVLSDDGLDEETKKARLADLVPPLLVDYLVESGVYSAARDGSS